jgi:DNA-binding NtrC family response regulator
VVELYIPPLRERSEEIGPLCEHFLSVNCEKYNRKKLFSERAIRCLKRHDWPGNVRELRNLVERIVLMTDSDIELLEEIPNFCFSGKGRDRASEAISGKTSSHCSAPGVRCDLPGFPTSFDPKKSFKEHVRHYEKWLANQAVKHYGSLERAAEKLSVDKSTLIRKRK